MKDTIRNTVKEVYNTNVNNFESNASVSWSPSLFESHVSETKKVVGDYPRNTNSVNNNNNNVNSQIKDTNHSSSFSFILTTSLDIVFSTPNILFKYAMISFR